MEKVGSIMGGDESVDEKVICGVKKERNNQIFMQKELKLNLCFSLS